MKYITTKESPIFKEGIQLRASFICDENHDNIEFLNGEDKITLPKPKFKVWLNKGYIKEVEEKEFTKSDGAEAILYFHNSYESSDMSIEEARNVFNDWLKQRDK